MNQLFHGVLSGSERDRVDSTWRKLAAHDVSPWVLTGGVATELHLREKGNAETRALHDLDFVVESFKCIPESLARDFVFRHIHPDAPPGKTLLQCVDPDTRVRIDVFRTSSDVVSRALSVNSCPSVLSKEDLTARSARLTWDLASGRTVAPKFVRDFLRLLSVTQISDVEAVWYAHRNASSPETFAGAAQGVCDLVASSSHLLVEPVYSTDLHAVCEHCRETATLKLADASVVLDLLGYC